MTAFIPLIAEALLSGGEAAASAEAGEVAGEAMTELPQDVGGPTSGHKIALNEAQIRSLLHSPPVVEAILKRANAIRDTANAMAITTGAEYRVGLQNRSDTTRARAQVYTGNYKAVVDEHYHATLLKAAAAHPSDPIPEGAGSGGPEPEGQQTGEVATNPAGTLSESDREVAIQAAMNANPGATREHVEEKLFGGAEK